MASHSNLRSRFNMLRDHNEQDNLILKQAEQKMMLSRDAIKYNMYETAACVRLYNARTIMQLLDYRDFGFKIVYAIYVLVIDQNVIMQHVTVMTVIFYIFFIHLLPMYTNTVFMC